MVKDRLYNKRNVYAQPFRFIVSDAVRKMEIEAWLSSDNTAKRKQIRLHKTNEEKDGAHSIFFPGQVVTRSMDCSRNGHTTRDFENVSVLERTDEYIRCGTQGICGAVYSITAAVVQPSVVSCGATCNSWDTTGLVVGDTACQSP